MYKISIITKDNIRKEYGESVFLFSIDSSLGSMRTTAIGLDELTPNGRVDISAIKVFGPYSIATIVKADPYNKLIIKSDSIEVIEVPDAVDELTPTLDRVVGKGNWVYFPEMLYINFPELTLTNTTGYSHTIKNLVVAFSLSRAGYVGSGLNGCRPTLTSNEVITRYCHSHLNDNLAVFQSFCQGGGSEFQHFMNAQGVHRMDPERFELFLLQLKSYLEWESIEGTPYIRMDQIGYPRIRGVNPDYVGPHVSYAASGSDDVLKGESDIDMLAATVIRQVINYPGLVKSSPIGGWLLIPQVASLDYFNIETSLYDLCYNKLTRVGQRYFFADYDVQNYRYVLADSNRAPSSISYGSEPRRVFAALGLNPQIIEEPPTTTTRNLVKLPQPYIRKMVLQRANVILAKAEQQLQLHGQGNSIIDKAESKDVREADVASAIPA